MRISHFWLLFALILAGCRGLNQPAAASFASVVIANHPPEEIQAAVGQVFREDGYAGRATGPGRMLFEKEGTRANSLAYNGIAGTQAGAGVQVRVRTELVDLGGKTYRLQCQAFMLRNAGDSFFEEETRLSNLRGGPYQKLLDETARRLQ